MEPSFKRQKLDVSIYPVNQHSSKKSETDPYYGHYLEKIRFEKIIEGLFPSKCADIALIIIQNFGFTTLGFLGQVNKNWSLLTHHFFAIKKVELYKNMCNPDDWNLQFGDNSISINERLEAFNSLRPDIDEISCLIYPEKKMMETHVMTWCPERIQGEKLTVNSYRKFLKQKYPDNEGGYLYIWDQAMKRYGDMPNKKYGWVAMPRELLLTSLDKNYLEQYSVYHSPLNRRVYESYSHPSIITLVVCISMEYFKSGKLMFEDSYIYCQESVITKSLMVGIDKKGITIDHDCQTHFKTYILPVKEF